MHKRTYIEYFSNILTVSDELCFYALNILIIIKLIKSFNLGGLLADLMGESEGGSPPQKKSKRRTADPGNGTGAVGSRVGYWGICSKSFLKVPCVCVQQTFFTTLYIIVCSKASVVLQ